ncbi:glycoside hydrolase [Chitinophaga lutea]|uniref:Glycoside hydrolase n=1 Tax=Chitinophaga lutea TaxID=2488634 RepID=A0A3N4PXN5_9BACT|nr:family 20 glycosylhydrolase [Chitinophaga lutea]RPE08847.1 glycoside hydrolase [Chitinophaga lutea]
MKRRLLQHLLAVCIGISAAGKAGAQAAPAFKWNELPVRGLLLSVPAKQDVPMFCDFIRTALVKEGVNTLAIRIEYMYQFKSHPELAEKNALSEAEMKQIVRACRDAKIRLIPTMNLMAHQSEQTEMGPLLKHYPQFDESPDFNPPVPWKDAGMFEFYSKSICPRHPDLLKVLFPIMDELVAVCEADALHVGLDEVWIIGYDKCPRCQGGDRSEIFAEYVNRLHAHLREKNVEMWMWSDRLIDGKTTNLLGWQASMNDTHRAIDRIPKDIVITDWKYESAPPTPGYFAIKGFNVLPSACAKTDVALAQLQQVLMTRKDGTRADWAVPLASRMRGVFETMWVNSAEFIRAYYGKGEYRPNTKDNADTFKALFKAIREAAK